MYTIIGIKDLEITNVISLHISTRIVRLKVTGRKLPISLVFRIEDILLSLLIVTIGVGLKPRTLHKNPGRRLVNKARKTNKHRAAANETRKNGHL